MKTSLTIDQITNLFVNQQCINERSKKTYMSSIVKFWKFCEIIKCDKRNLTFNSLVLYREYLLKTYSKKYTATLLTVLKLFFKWATPEIFPIDLAMKIKCPKKESKFIKHPLTYDKKIKLLTCFKNKEDVKSIRDLLIVTMMLNSGLRCVEISNANIEDIYIFDDKLYMKIQRKGHTTKNDSINITHYQNEINRYVGLINRTSGPLFFSATKKTHIDRFSPEYVGLLVRKYLIAANIKNEQITVHSLRHTAAYDLISAKFPIEEIRLFLGHTSTEITKLYTDYASTEIIKENRAGMYLMSEFIKIKEIANN